MKKKIITAILLLLATLAVFLLEFVGTANSSEAELACVNNSAAVQSAAKDEYLAVTAAADTEKVSRAAGSELTVDEQEVLDLINNERTANGLAPLVIDKELENIARLKARDMVNKDYFSHESKEYGSPFDMMKDFGIIYKTAGENIAGNESNADAVKEWMNSPDHKANILSSSYTCTGIAAQKGSIYGKIFVQEFVGK
ncbi:MAG: CAP domain-containing protein [Firmicutes bacterium]|nr:CAP domain-containing protein [Bacillota bacterium]